MTSAVAKLSPPLNCYHCDLPLPSDASCGATIDGQWRAMCCPGCAAIAEAIVDQGFGAYYRQRELPGGRPSEVDDALPPEIFDDPELQHDFVRSEEASCEATFSLEGVRCAACAWLIEGQLRSTAGVSRADVSLASHRAIVRYDPDCCRVSELLRAVRQVGYTAHPYEPDRESLLAQREQRAALVRIGVSGLGAMQVMMFSVALYAGALEGMSAPYRELMRWVSLLVATFVVSIGARPFFAAATRDLRARQLGMDVPVALAIGLAYFASAVATFSGAGEVYFDSVCMFTFLLSLGRFLESRVRYASDERVRALARRTPNTARRLTSGDEEIVPLRALRRGDLVSVRPGESIPLDGIVVHGDSAVSEGMWTGEDAPCRKRSGDWAIGGSQNLESPLRIVVRRTMGEGTLAAIRAMIDRAQIDKPPIARAADRVARAFVGALLFIAAVTAAVWWTISPDDALWVTLSVLVATCPCALSLATPAALAAATESLAGAGFLVTRGHTLEVLARVSSFVFDKTGTLTTRRLELAQIVPVSRNSGERWSRDRALELATLLEAESVHPIAAAFPKRANSSHNPVAKREGEPGQGVGAWVGRRQYRLGRPSWVSEIFDPRDPRARRTQPCGEGSWILLGGEREGPIAWICLRSALRGDARSALSGLRERGIETCVLSGDPSESEVERVANLVGASTAVGGASPKKKVELLAELQRNGKVVAAVGDGVNDAPLLSRAQVSIAMGSGTDLARVSADAVLVHDRLTLICDAIDCARKTRTIVLQNLGWAAIYNALVLPLAVTGHLPPYLAALGMASSSLVVVLNALRLRRAVPVVRST